MARLPDLEAWAVFAKVAENGSFGKAAQELGLANTTVSKTTTRLEQRMRTTLLHRTTRKLSLTETGRLSLERATRILADGFAIEADILEEAAIPRGLVRLACTAGFGVESLAPLIPEFMKLYPEIEVELCLTEDEVDIVAQGFDAAIRIGQGGDSSLRSSRLFSFRRLVVAAPALVESIGRLDSPEQLASVPAIIATHIPWGTEWEFQRSGEHPVTIRVSGSYRVNSAAAMVPAAVAGLGVMHLPEYFVWRELQSGALIELLPEWVAPPGPVHVVTPPGRARPARVRVLLDFLRERFSAQPWAAGIER
ncbi:LysR family transcriptional regulator [Sphingomonas sp. BK345]|uniref:LysR family transcriptional regulator n=1 Tax=Sphingomonas sp. BK345 TaxID=2586980 RepID=UPI00161F1507|nr:LysR family transcriptional regulator [Sphingomonas sp. BK345]MBB3473568.1 DNA-binding transcriptional LysR family regulator [Sphingomonas sp. BK345]